MEHEQKWETNRQKVAYLKNFPGLLSSWDQSIGATIEQIISMTDRSNSSVLLLSHGKFLVTPQVHTEPQAVTAGLIAARPLLECIHAQAFQEYDRLAQQDEEARKQARLQNILNAIDNNLEHIPELKSHIRALVSQWDHERPHA